MKVKVLAFEKKSFSGRDGKEVVYYRCCVQTSDGKIGFVSANNMPQVGSLYDLTLKTKADNSFYVRISN